MIGQTLPAYAQAAIRYWWLFALQGFVALAVGGFLVFKPDRTVSFVAVVLGIYLIFWGFIQIIGAFVIRDRFALNVIVGIIAVAAGAVIVGNPEKTVNLVVIFIGIYLVLWGLYAMLALFGDRPDKLPRVIGGALAAVAGLFVIAWPGPSLSLVAIVFGIWLIASGIVEIVGALRLRRLKAAEAV